LSQGRLGLQSAAYGGSSPELLALETARQEAMARANLGARQQAMAEQQQLLGAASGLLGAGYTPQREALNVLNVASIAPQLASRGALGGSELMSQLAQSGVEGNLGMQQLATEMRQARDQGLMETLLGRQPTMQEMIQGSYVGLDPKDLIQQGALNYIGGLLSGRMSEEDAQSAVLDSFYGDDIENIDAVLNALLGD